MRRKLLIIFLFIPFQSVFSQSTWNSFWHLNGPEKCWVLSHPFIAYRAKKITANVLSVSDEIKKDTMLDGDPNGGQVDAFRHAFWMASLSQKISWRKAISLGKAHEKGNYKNFRKGKTDEEKIFPDSVSGVMDLYNNNVGTAIGCQNKNLNNDELKNLIRSLILQGRMKIILKNKEGGFLDCNGKLIEMNLFKNTWGVPKCLKKSDYRISQ